MSKKTESPKQPKQRSLQEIDRDYSNTCTLLGDAFAKKVAAEQMIAGFMQRIEQLQTEHAEATKAMQEETK